MTKSMIFLAAALLLTCAIAFHLNDPTARYIDPHPASPAGYSSCDPTNAPELCTATILDHNIPSTDPAACHSDCGIDDDAWIYAGKVQGHANCFQLTISPQRANFRCEDGAKFSLTAP